MAKIYLSPSNQKSNIGVGEYGSEKSRMIQIAEVMAGELRRKFEVKMANYDWNLQPRVNESNNWDSDIYVAIHSNAGGGKGCEVYAYSTESDGYRLAQSVYNRVQAITPSGDRGIKFNELYETKYPYCPAILIEVAFHDNWDDANWIINNIEVIGVEITKGIYEYFGITYEEPKLVEPVKPILEIKDIENKKIKLKIDAHLWDLNFVNYDNVKSVKQFKTGDIIEVSAIAKHSLGASYYLTEYSYSKGINNGFNILDCEDYIEPIIEEPIVEEPEPINPPVIPPIPEESTKENIWVTMFKIIVKLIKEILGGK